MNKTTAIRVSVSREFSHSEKEWVRAIMKLGDESLVWTNWDGEKMDFIVYPFHIRLSERGKFWIHSNTVESRRLYDIFCGFLEDNFVNVHPVAVRTFSSIPMAKDQGSVRTV